MPGPGNRQNAFFFNGLSLVESGLRGRGACFCEPICKIYRRDKFHGKESAGTWFGRHPVAGSASRDKQRGEPRRVRSLASGAACFAEVDDGALSQPYPGRAIRRAKAVTTRRRRRLPPAPRDLTASAGKAGTDGERCRFGRVMRQGCANAAGSDGRSNRRV
jgi:hypothetical protein